MVMYLLLRLVTRDASRLYEGTHVTGRYLKPYDLAHMRGGKGVNISVFHLVNAYGLKIKIDCISCVVLVFTMV